MIFRRAKSRPTTKFARFFTQASPRKKERLFRRVLKQVNKEQRELVERYGQK